MKSLLFKRRVVDGDYKTDHLFTAPEGTQEILPFGQEGTSQKLTGDWELHYKQQTSPLNVHSSMAFSLEEFPVERINSKYFIGDSTTNDIYYDELSAPSHLKNCVHGSESESYGTIYFIEVVDASQPASFYMQQKEATYVPFMGWFTTFGRNRSRSRRITIATENTDTVFVHCIEAVHIDQEGDESLPYCWEVPKGMEIEIGDTLVVESRVGSQHIVVVATTEPYSLERYTATGLSVDTESNHPYCAVVYNCGKL